MDCTVYITPPPPIEWWYVDVLADLRELSFLLTERERRAQALRAHVTARIIPIFRPPQDPGTYG